MKKIYTSNDTNSMDWEEYGKILNSLIDKIIKYQNDMNIKFDIVVPVLRSGAIPATAIANKLHITKYLPVQIKYIHKENQSNHEQLMSIPELLQSTPNNPNILICENNTGTGKSAIKIINLIKEKYPSSNIYYCTVAKVYGGPDHYNDVQNYFYGVQTNEFFKANDEEIVKFKLRPKITIFPWENIEDELSAINSDK